MHRRHFHQLLVASGTALAVKPTWATPSKELSTSDRVRGMLIGSMIGDAAGGPVEFGEYEKVRGILADTRAWKSDRRIDASELSKLADGFPLADYADVRPEPASYGPWTTNAPAGTVTDDTRHKFVMLDTLRQLRDNPQQSLTSRDLAKAYINYANRPFLSENATWAKLNEECFREFCYAAHWVLGERDLRKARPPARQWSGVATCAGQMTLLPIAGIFPGNPTAAYRAAYSVGFIDNGPGKDLNAALVAGLATAIAPTENTQADSQWNNVIKTIRETDPLGYSQVKFVGRPLHKWLDLAHSIAEKADGQPTRLFAMLEKDAEPVYWWDAHFIIVCAFSILRFCKYNPLAAMHLVLDFGHDTDSAAQVIGAFAGAIHGPAVFPAKMRDTVLERVSADYHEDLDEMVNLLLVLQDRDRYAQPFVD